MAKKGVSGWTWLVRRQSVQRPQRCSGSPRPRVAEAAVMAVVMARTGGPAGARLRRTDGSGERLRRRVARRASRGLTVSLPAAAQTTCQVARGRRQNTSSRPARLPRSSGRGGTHALSLPSLRRRVVRRGRALECHSRGEASKGSAVAHDWPAALAGLRAEVRTHGTPPDARQPGLPTGSVRRVWGPERVLSVWPAGSRVSDAGRNRPSTKLSIGFSP